MNLDALDRWITGGRYRKEPLSVTCGVCDTVSSVVCETEYGMSMWDPEECPACGSEWDEDTEWGLDEPPDTDPHEWRL